MANIRARVSSEEDIKVKKRTKTLPVIEVDEIEAESERIERETACGIDPARPGPRLFSRFGPQEKIRLVMRRQKDRSPKAQRGTAAVRATFNALKKRTVLSEDELQELTFASTLPAKLRETLVSFVIVAGKEHSGPMEEGEEAFWISKFRHPGPWPSFFGRDYWPSTNAVSIQAGISKATARRGLRELILLGVLVPKYPANSYVLGFGLRHTATYVLNLGALSHKEPTARIA